MCFGERTFTSKTKSYVATSFTPGTVVRIVRKAESHEKGWDNTWAEDMTQSVGKTGIVVIQDQWGVLLNVDNDGGRYQYPEFILEPVKPKVVATEKTGFVKGDRVTVTKKRGGSFVGVPGTIDTDIDSDLGHYVNFDSTGDRIYFFETSLESIVPVKAEFAVGDYVQVVYGHGWNGWGDVTEISQGPVYHVKYPTGRMGGFYAKSLRPAVRPVRGTRSSVGVKPLLDRSIERSAYEQAVKAALQIAASKGSVTADDVQAELTKNGYTPQNLGNAAGSVFLSKKFRKIGEVRSTRPSNRGRKIAQWSLASV